MLIHALCDYYEILRKRGKVRPEGYSQVGISYLISLSSDGKIADIIDYQVTDTSEKKPKPRPRNLLFPKRTEKPGIESNFIEHRPIYIFGLMYDKLSDSLVAVDRTKKAQKSHEAFVKYNLEQIDGIDEPLVNAYRAFLETWDPSAETENPLLAPLRKLIGSGTYFAFCPEGNPGKFLQEVPEIQARWNETLNQDQPGGVTGRCAVTGESGTIARLHDKIKGVAGGQSSGTALICFNSESEESYGATQAYNSNITEETMRKYTEALNYLLASRQNKTLLDEMTVVHWAASMDEDYDDVFDECLNGSEEVSNALEKLLKNARDGLQQVDMSSVLRDMDPSVSFYTVGLKPNASRLAVKFIYRNTFAALLLNIAQHLEDMKISPDFKPVPLWQLKAQLISPKSTKEKIDPALMSKLFGAVINGTRYPSWLLSTLVRRIRTDSEVDPRSNEIRMGMLKACINRNARLNGKKEVITVALDKTNENPAYLCGRLFAVLESIQQRASNYSLNRTIKDAYFASASVRPAVIFPKLIALAQYHLSKLDNSYFADKEITELVACLGNEFPAILSLKEQGVFMLGYYQQKADTQQRIKQYKEEK